METPAARRAPPSFSLRLRRVVERIGDAGVRGAQYVYNWFAFIGGLTLLLGETLRRTGRALLPRKARLGRSALLIQMVRVGVRSVPIVVLLQIFIGIILALQLAPTMESYGQKEKIADIVAIAIFRELGPLISAVVLAGFAGASIAAELGAMVEGEEIKALRAIDLNPVEFLVVPRVIATTVMLTGVTVIADVVGVLGGLGTAISVLRLDFWAYMNETRYSVQHHDFTTGLVKAAVFGLLISLIACYEGLHVRGGAVGVGRATTSTVVKSIVALIATDCVFTSVFYTLGW